MSRKLLGPERGAGLDPALVASTSEALAHGMIPIFMAAAAIGTGTAARGASADDPLFRISLAQWSFFRTLFAGRMTTLDFPVVARRELEQRRGRHRRDEAGKGVANQQRPALPMAPHELV